MIVIPFRYASAAFIATDADAIIFELYLHLVISSKEALFHCKSDVCALLLLLLLTIPISLGVSGRYNQYRFVDNIDNIPF